MGIFLKYFSKYIQLDVDNSPLLWKYGYALIMGKIL